MCIWGMSVVLGALEPTEEAPAPDVWGMSPASKHSLARREPAIAAAIVANASALRRSRRRRWSRIRAAGPSGCNRGSRQAERPDGPRDVLEPFLAEIDEWFPQPIAHLLMRGAR